MVQNENKCKILTENFSAMRISKIHWVLAENAEEWRPRILKSLPGINPLKSLRHCKNVNSFSLLFQLTRTVSRVDWMHNSGGVHLCTEFWSKIFVCTTLIQLHAIAFWSVDFGERCWTLVGGKLSEKLWKTFWENPSSRECRTQATRYGFCLGMWPLDAIRRSPFSVASRLLLPFASPFLLSYFPFAFRWPLRLQIRRAFRSSLSKGVRRSNGAELHAEAVNDPRPLCGEGVEKW